MNKPKPSELELKILSRLWDDGPLTVRQVLESLPDGKGRAYTTILSMLQLMERKGLAGREREGLAHRWHAAVDRDEVMGPMLKRMVAQVFSGRPSAVLQQLLRQAPVDREELRSIKKLIRDYEKQFPPEGK